MKSIREVPSEEIVWHKIIVYDVIVIGAVSYRRDRPIFGGR